MAIQKDNLGYLDNNSYESIIIIEDKLNTSYTVNIKEGKNDCDEQLTLEANNFFDTIKDLPEPKKVEQIIYHFLKNNKIVSLSDTQIIPGYQYLFNIIEGEDASLALRLFCDKKILCDCAEKYEFDRYKFLKEEKDVFCYEMFTSENTSSYVEEVNHGRKIIKLTLLKKDEKLWWKDNNFFNNWILQKLEEQGVRAEYVYLLDYSKEQGDYIFNIPKLVCGDLIIYLTDRWLERRVKLIVKKYNEDLENKKRLQLKMEGL